MESDGSLMHSRNPATRLYTEPAESSPKIILYLETHCYTV